MSSSESRRVIAMDVGDVRIGVAVSDPLGLIAQPLEVYKRIGYTPDVKYALALCERYKTNRVVLGLPLNMDGSLGGQAEKVKTLGDRMVEAGLQVEYQDERMSTVTAERALIDGQMRREERRKTVDKVAAAVILEQWLASPK